MLSGEEAFLYHHQASFDLESSSEAKERSSMEPLKTFARSRDQVHGQELVPAREGCTGHEAMERLLRAFAPEKE